ncbi:MAG: putative Ig domain-containing protein, partial [Pseudomonadota bacterium]
GAVFELDAGFHTITLAGRSPGFNVDFIEINKGGNPGVNSANSQFVATGDTVPVVNDQIEDINVQVGDGLAFAIPGDAFFDADGDTLFIDAPNLPTGFTFVNGVLSAESDLAIGSYPITITATDDDLNVAVQTFVVTVSEDVPVSDFQAIVVSGADDIELGSSLNSPDLESDKVVQLRFTVQEGVSNVTSVETAFFNFVSDRGQGGTTTLNFEARPSYDALPFESTNSFVGDGQSVTFTDSWDDNEFISGVIDLAPLINDLIADQGPLNAGDIINLQFTGTGADRYIVQGTGVLDISGTGGGGGPTNLAPVVDNPVADLEVADGDGVNINLANVFSDPEDDALTLQVSGLPDGVSFSGTTISGTPTETGVFTVTVTANDGEKSVADVFVITVLTDQDTMPAVGADIADQSVLDGEAYSFAIPANAFTDLDGDTLEITVDAPAGFGFNANTDTVTAAAGLAAGTYTITVTATDDDNNSVSQDYTVTKLEPFSSAPVVDVDIPDQSVADGEAYSFAIPANAFDDADGDTLEITVNAPAGFGYNANTDTVTAPVGLAAGVYTITVTATDDDNNSISQDYVVTKEEPFSSEPEVDVEIPDQTVNAGDAFSFAVPANAFDDADGDALTITATSLPNGFSFNPANDTVTAPGNLAPGTYTITVQAEDDDGNTVTQDFNVTVVDTSNTFSFVAELESKNDDVELGFNERSSELETNKAAIQMRLTIEDGVAGATFIESALVSWTAINNSTGSAVLTFQVEDSLAPEAYGANKSFVGGSVQTTVQGPWFDDQLISNVVDIAPLLNALIASQGPLSAGDVINLQIDGVGDNFQIQQFSTEVAITASGAPPQAASSAFASFAAPEAFALEGADTAEAATDDSANAVIAIVSEDGDVTMPAETAVNFDFSGILEAEAPVEEAEAGADANDRGELTLLTDVFDFGEVTSVASDTIDTSSLVAEDLAVTEEPAEDTPVVAVAPAEEDLLDGNFAANGLVPGQDDDWFGPLG